ncbi:MAG: hypothetical protein FWG99_00810 [Treponema sp.]|nr:hypothetical protein [Treponema sp.]
MELDNSENDNHIDKPTAPTLQFLRILVKRGFIASLVLSLVVSIIYLAGVDFSDETLFFLLWALRILSFFVFAFSLHSLILITRNYIKGTAPVSITAIILYVLSALLGAGLIVFNAFIVAIAGGNI